MSLAYFGLCGESSTVFPDGGFNGFTAFACAFLNASNKLIQLAFDELEVIISELGPLLFEVALDDVPVAFDFECCHKSLC